MKKKSINKNEVYSTTGFSDLVASPFFYSLLVITLILGLASTYGFFQNPRKLKLIIDLISQGLFISEVEKKVAPKIVNNRANSLANKKLRVIYKRDGNITASSLEIDRYSIFAEEFTLTERKKTPINSTVSIAFNYNISYGSIWESLDLTSKKERRIDTPISPYYSLKKDPLRYSLRVNHTIL